MLLQRCNNAGSRRAYEVLSHRCHPTLGKGWVGANNFTSGARQAVGRLSTFKVVAFQPSGSTQLATASGSELSKPEPGLRYRFVVPEYCTSFGQSLKVVGSHPELGAWSADAAPSMTWKEGHQWVLEVNLPPKAFEFKVIVVEGNNVKWEGGNNRIVQADDEDMAIPVEVVVYLTCNFNLTETTGMHLAIPRASVEDAFETARARLEFLEMRRTKVGKELEKEDTAAADKASYQAEMLRLHEAFAEQDSSVQELGDLLKRGGNGNGNGNSSITRGVFEDEASQLLLAVEKVAVPQALRRIAFASVAIPPALPSGAAVEAADALPEPDATANTLLGIELEEQAGDLLGSADVLHEELETSPSTDSSSSKTVSSSQADSTSSSPSTRSAIASLAEEASVMVAALRNLASTDQLGRSLMEGLSALGSSVGLQVVTESAATAAAADKERAGSGTAVTTGASTGDKERAGNGAAVTIGASTGDKERAGNGAARAGNDAAVTTGASTGDKERAGNGAAVTTGASTGEREGAAMGTGEGSPDLENVMAAVELQSAVAELRSAAAADVAVLRTVEDAQGLAPGLGDSGAADSVPMLFEMLAGDATHGADGPGRSVGAEVRELAAKAVTVLDVGRSDSQLLGATALAAAGSGAQLQGGSEVVLDQAGSGAEEQPGNSAASVFLGLTLVLAATSTVVLSIPGVSAKAVATARRVAPEATQMVEDTLDMWTASATEEAQKAVDMLGTWAAPVSEEAQKVADALGTWAASAPAEAQKVEDLLSKWAAPASEEAQKMVDMLRTWAASAPEAAQRVEVVLRTWAASGPEAAQKVTAILSEWASPETAQKVTDMLAAWAERMSV